MDTNGHEWEGEGENREWTRMNANAAGKGSRRDDGMDRMEERLGEG